MADMEKGEHSATMDTVHAVQGFGAIALTYNWLAESVNLLASVLIPKLDGPLLPGVFEFPIGIGPLFPPIWWPIWYCILVGFITYVVIRWVCERRWVARTYLIRECIQVNPFGVIICFFKFVTVWVLKIICRWVAYIISIPIWICFVIWVWRLF